MIRRVRSSLSADVLAPATLELQVAVAAPRPVVEELVVTVDGAPVGWRELATEAGGRLHLVRVPAGRLEVSYRAEVHGRAEAVPVGPLDATTYLRPSRYAESDRLASVAAAELGGT